MASRREFLQTSAAAVAWLPMSGQAFREGRSPVPFYKVVYDEGIAPCRAFADEARRLGATLHAIQDGDVRDLWYHDLYFRWKEGPVVVAGLTLEPSAFNLEILARDGGQRQVFRGDHVLAARTRLDHRLSGPAPLVAHTDTLGEAGEAWSIQIARLLAQFDGRLAHASERSVRTAVTDPSGIPEHLVSWILAPRAA